MNYSIIIPTLNAEKYLNTLLDSLESQTVAPQRIIILDSESDDHTELIARTHSSVDFHTIKRSAFDHAGTRNYGVKLCDTPFFVFMTQDALPVNKVCMESMLSLLNDSQAAAVCARQIAYRTSTPYEKMVRAYRYPGIVRIWTKRDVESLGIQAYLLSDVCTAYRRTAFESVGGFTEPLMTNEDMLIAADFLEAGYSLAYNGKSEVWHSHDYSFRQSIERNRKIGSFMKKYRDRFDGEIGEGSKMAKTVTVNLIKQGDYKDLIPFWWNCFSRVIGYWIGQHDC